jgi:hypothetical protein
MIMIEVVKLAERYMVMNRIKPRSRERRVLAAFAAWALTQFPFDDGETVRNTPPRHTYKKA